MSLWCVQHADAPTSEAHDATERQNWAVTFRREEADASEGEEAEWDSRGGYIISMCALARPAARRAVRANERSMVCAFVSEG